MGGDCNDHHYFLLIAFDTNQIRYFFWTCEILKCVKYIARESRVDGYVNKLNNIVRAQCPVTKPNVSIKENLSVKCSLVVIDDFTARPQ